jgi:signal transduction histidine kinase
VTEAASSTEQIDSIIAALKAILSRRNGQSISLSVNSSRSAGIWSAKDRVTVPGVPPPLPDSHRIVYPLVLRPLGLIAEVELWVSTVGFRHGVPQLDEPERAGLMAWIISKYTPAVYFELTLLRELGVCEPVLFRMRSLASADAAVLWCVQGADPARTLKVASTSGLHPVSIDIPIGWGILGNLDLDTEYRPLINLEESLGEIGHPGLVSNQGWKWCQAFPIFEGGTYVALAALYYKTLPPVNKSNRSAQGYIDRCLDILACNVVSMAADRHRDLITSTLSARAGKIEAGLAVLGLAHDLTRRVNTLATAASMLGNVLPKNKSGLASLGFKDSVSPESMVTMLDTVGENAQYIASIISLINAISVDQKIYRSKSDLSRLVEKVHPLLDGLTENIQPIVYLLARSNKVRASETDIVRILLNLITNSVRWDAKKIEIEVRNSDHQSRSEIRVGDRRAQKGSKTILSVIDSGIGMTEETISHCREAFTSSHESGTGLGLFIVDDLVKKLGGDLHISSTFGVGTRVDIAFPPVEKETRSD